MNKKLKELTYGQRHLLGHFFALHISSYDPVFAACAIPCYPVIVVMAVRYSP